MAKKAFGIFLGSQIKLCDILTKFGCNKLKTNHLYMKTAYVVGIVITLVLGCLFSWKCCEEAMPTAQDTSQTVVGTPFLIRDLTGDFSYQSEENIEFEVSDYIIKRPVTSAIAKGI